MKRITEIAAIALAVTGITGRAAALFGQPPAGADPFGEAKTPAVEAPKPVPEQKAEVAEEPDPLVLAIRAASTARPEDVLWAAETALNAGRPEEAKRQMQRLLQRSPGSDTLAGLRRRFGSALFLRLIREPAVQPEGQQLGRAVLEASDQVARAPDRLQALVARLADPSAEVRQMALVDLQEAGEAAGAALLAVLADRNQPAAMHAAAKKALVGLGEDAVGPLAAALAAEDAALQCQACEVLGQLESAAAVPYLLRPALEAGGPPELRQAAAQALSRIAGETPSRAEAGRYLEGWVHAHLEGKTPWRVDEQGLASVWVWDSATRSVAVRKVSARAASLMVAVRIAGELRRLAADRPDYQRLYLTACLEAAKSAAGLDQPLPAGPGTARAEVAAAGANAVEDVLTFSLEKGYTSAAIGALEVLAQIGDAGLLQSAGGRPRPVTAALRHPDSRVRFAAAAAIVRWDPRRAYAGCSWLPETLAYFARARGTPRVLIGHPRTAEATTLAGILHDLGLEADTAQTGREVFRLATGNPDYELLLLSDALSGPGIEETIAQLRRDPNSARIPIGLMAQEQNLPSMERFAEKIPRTVVLPRVVDAAGAELQLRRVASVAAGHGDGGPERVRRAEFALDYLMRLVEQPERYSFYDVRAQYDVFAHALSNPRMVAKAARALGYLASPAAQLELVTLASRNERPLAERQAAAAAFAAAVQRRGLLLSRAEILLQYDRYNRSATLDRDTQQVLGRILDAIEAPSWEQRGRTSESKTGKVQKEPRPPAPRGTASGVSGS